MLVVSVKAEEIEDFLSATRKFVDEQAERILIQSKIAALSSNPQMVAKAQKEVGELKTYLDALRTFTGVLSQKIERN